jgi:hypothetical protein
MTVASLALAALCLTVSGFSVRTAAADDAPTLPPSWSQFAGSWEVAIPYAPSSDEAKKGGQRILPPYRVSVSMSDGGPKVVLTRFKLQADWDGTLRFVPIRQLTSSAQVQGETLTFRIDHDALARNGEASEPVDTLWALELKDREKGTLRSISSQNLAPVLPAPLAMRRAFPDPATEEGC